MCACASAYICVCAHVVCASFSRRELLFDTKLNLSYSECAQCLHTENHFRPRTQFEGGEGGMSSPFFTCHPPLVAESSEAEGVVQLNMLV